MQGELIIYISAGMAMPIAFLATFQGLACCKHSAPKESLWRN